MSRAFLIVMDSAGIGGAPDADRYFNDDRPDTGANTIGHIAEACAAGRAEDARTFSDSTRAWPHAPGKRASAMPVEKGPFGRR